MAIFGRGQPHKPIILTLLRFAPAGPAPVGKAVIIQKAALVNADRFYRRPAAPRPRQAPAPGAPAFGVPGGGLTGKFSPAALAKAHSLLSRVPDVSTAAGRDRLRRATEILSDIMNSLAGGGHLARSGRAAWQLRGGAFTAARAPLASDDSAAGAFPGVLFVDTLGQAAYVCVSNAPGAAVWKKITT